MLFHQKEDSCNGGQSRSPSEYSEGSRRQVKRKRRKLLGMILREFRTKELNSFLTAERQIRVLLPGSISSCDEDDPNAIGMQCELNETKRKRLGGVQLIII